MNEQHSTGTSKTTDWHDVVTEMGSRFTSLNAIPVERATIKRHEWEAILQKLLDLLPADETSTSSPTPVAEELWEKHWFAMGDCVRVVSQNCDLHDIVRRGKWLQQELSQRGFQLIVAEGHHEIAL